jgi:hypothetical protein
LKKKNLNATDANNRKSVSCGAAEVAQRLSYDEKYLQSAEAFSKSSISLSLSFSNSSCVLVHPSWSLGKTEDSASFSDSDCHY